MKPRDFVATIPDFHSLPPYDQIKAFAWYLQSDGVERFDNDMIRECFNEADMTPPHLAVYIPRLAEKKRGVFLRDARGYRLVGPVRSELDARYGRNPSEVAITKLLSELPSQIPDIEQREFLNEALNCYKVGAFRATVVMTWNLAYDHVLRWIIADNGRLAEFNDAIPKKFPKKNERITALTSFEELREAEVLAILRASKLDMGKNVLDILDEKLKRRNAAAHPSRVSIKQPQTDAIVMDLVQNVVLLLK